MSRAEDHRCASDYVKTRAPILAERLVTANMRLVVKIARDYRRAQYDMVDLIQEGNLGLMRAVARYDPHRGVKLSSYAAWWIRAYILKFTIDNWRLVKAGTTQPQRKLFFGLHRERRKLESSGVEADIQQLAAALDVKETHVVGMLERFAGGEISLDTPRSPGERGSKAIGDALSEASALRPDVRVETSEFSRRVRAELKIFGCSLRGRELAIFRRRLVSEEPETLTQLAVGFGVTRERTRQLEQGLKKKLRDYLREQLGDALELGGVLT
jgi:RNA polymerase sigma-32 factor